jgi:hypothetical protein
VSRVFHVFTKLHKGFYILVEDFVEVMIMLAENGFLVEKRLEWDWAVCRIGEYTAKIKNAPQVCCQYGKPGRLIIVKL